MTLSYWWMHWFWITSHFIFVLSSDAVVTSHSISPDLNQMVSAGSNTSGDPSSSTQQQQHRAAKAFSGAQQFIPPINDSPSSSTPASNGSNNNYNNNNNNVRNVSVVKFQKTSGKKTPPEYPHHQPTTTTTKTNVTTNNNTTTKVYFRSKDQSVINQNRSDINASDSKQQQELVNISFVNSTEQEDNFSGIYANETTSFNQSLINSERIAERDDDDDDASENLSAAGITGITLGCVIVVGVICGVSYVLYRNRGFNRPQVLNDRCSNPDSSGYIDDASVRDNSEEMYSLDNDSFLNSLEAMTIQNYWTDTVKHTKL